MANNLFLISNIISFILIGLIGLIAFFMEGMTFKKISLKHITIIATFGAVSIALTNLVGYSIPFFKAYGNIQLALGDWIIFLLGMMFGPLIGVLSAITTDSLGMIVNASGAYHSGFLLNKVVLGFFGSLVFIFKKDKRIWLKVIVFYGIGYILQTLILNPIWLWALYEKGFIIYFIPRAIKLPFVLPIYIGITYGSFKTIKPLLDRWSYENIWCFRHIVNNDNLINLD